MVRPKEKLTCALPSNPARERRCQPGWRDTERERARKLTCESVLSHENADNSDVRGARAHAPANRVRTRGSVVDERPEDELAGLVLGRSSEHGDDERGRADGVPPDRDVVDVPEEVHTKGVDEALRDEHRGINADRNARLRNEVRVEGRESGDEIRATEAGEECQNEDSFEEKSA